jgi:hypothetical protein
MIHEYLFHLSLIIVYLINMSILSHNKKIGWYLACVSFENIHTKIDHDGLLQGLVQLIPSIPGLAWILV